MSEINQIAAERAELLKIWTRKARELSVKYNEAEHSKTIVKWLMAMNNFDGHTEGELFPIALLEEMVKIQKEKLSKICDGKDSEIVKLMFDMSQNLCVTNDQIEVKIEEILNVSTSVSEAEDKETQEAENEAARQKLFAWLNENGYGNVIKGRRYIAEETLGESKEAIAEKLEVLAENGIETVLDATVNTNTLKALLNEHIKPVFDESLGFEVVKDLPPPDALKTSRYVRAKLKFPKVSKKENTLF